LRGQAQEQIGGWHAVTVKRDVLTELQNSVPHLHRPRLRIICSNGARALPEDRQLLKAQALAGGVVQPVAFSLNVDGKTLAQALINIGQAGFEGQAPAFNGLTSFSNGDSQYTDK
jgi:hypothetical protein